MPSLKSKASGKKSGGSLKAKAVKPEETETIGPEEHEQMAPREAMPNVSSGLSFNAPPPLPPEFSYLDLYARIPGLRKRQEGAV